MKLKNAPLDKILYRCNGIFVDRFKVLEKEKKSILIQFYFGLEPMGKIRTEDINLDVFNRPDKAIEDYKKKYKY